MKKKLIIEIEWENLDYSLRIHSGDEKPQDIQAVDVNLVVGVLNQVIHSYLRTISKRTTEVSFKKDQEDS